MLRRGSDMQPALEGFELDFGVPSPSSISLICSAVKSFQASKVLFVIEPAFHGIDQGPAFRLADAAPLIGRLAANVHLQLGYMAKPSSKIRGGHSFLPQSVRSVAANCGD